MPTRWNVLLEGGRLNGVDPRHLHAAVSTWLDLRDSEHSADLKPWSVGLPQTNGSAVRIPVSTVDDSLDARLAAGAQPGRPLRLGSTTLRVRAAVPEEHLSWQELAQGRRERAWVLRFVTPVTFRQGDRSTPLVTASPLLRGLGLKWQQFAPKGLWEGRRDDADQVWVSDLEGASQTVRVGDSTMSGFVGRMRFVCDDARAAARVAPLMALAPFVGVGSRTAWGMGVTVVEPTWQPREPGR